MSCCARNYISSGHQMDARSAGRRRMTNAYAALATGRDEAGKNGGSDENHNGADRNGGVIETDST